MAGGVGTRFWPQSRRRRPKQFLALEGGRTLLQETARRLRPIVPWSRMVVVAPRDLAPLVRRQLPALPRTHLVIEPAARGTAACLALVGGWIARRDPRASMAVFPADHAIRAADRFERCVRRAFEVAETHDSLVTFGIPPSAPETGYGYIEIGAALNRARRDVHWAERFVENPTSGRRGGSSHRDAICGTRNVRVARGGVAQRARASRPALGRVMDDFGARGAR